MADLDLPAVANADQETHVPDHNKIRQALIDINTGATTINPQTDSYTLVLADAGKTVEMGKATVQNLTVPLNATVPFPIGIRVDILQTGAGQVTVVPVSGAVTINFNGGLKISGQWKAATLMKRGTDLWVLIGALSA